MISDTLADAVEEIRRYQREIPSCYAGNQREIDAVVGVMGGLREFFDSSPMADRESLLSAFWERFEKIAASGRN